jgi:prephenate dehydrogenase
MKNKQSLLIYGVGAFGEFIFPHLQRYFDVYLYDKYKDLTGLSGQILVDPNNISKIDIIIIAVPVQYMKEAIQSSAPYVKKGQLVMDIASVKVLPQEWLIENMPDDVDLIGLHPLFGPNSGQYGIEGLNVTVCDIRSLRYKEVCSFLSNDLGLNVTQCNAEKHDLDMAYVQGLTHVIAKSFSKMNVPEIANKTQTYIDLVNMVKLIKDDSDELFQAIQNYNPYAKDIRSRFLDRVKEIESDLEG